MSSAIKPLLTVTANSVGGRNGHSETTDHSVAVDLSVAKEMGGPGKAGTTTPEHLFAAGYAACFGGALDYVSNQHKLGASKAHVTCNVAIGPRDGGGFGVSVHMKVVDKTVPQAQLEMLVHETHETICPYSHATRGNIPWQLTVEGA